MYSHDDPSDPNSTMTNFINNMMIMNKVIFQRQLFPVIKKGQVMSNYYRLMNRQGEQRYFDHRFAVKIIGPELVLW